MSGNRENQEFWKSLFEREKLSTKIAEIENESSKNNPKGVHFHLPNYGKTLVQVASAAPAGTNFMSGVYTLQAIAENGDGFTAFAKITRTDPFTQRSTFLARSYHREIGTYQDLFPILCHLREEKGLTARDIPINTPKVYYTNLVECTEESRYSNETTVVIEELKSQGFQMLDPTVGCDFDHAKLAMETYAHYHSLSIAFYRKWKVSNGKHHFPSSLEVFNENPYFLNLADAFRNGILESYCAVLHMSNMENEAKWLIGLKPRLDAVLDFEANKMAGPLTCILHGDSWNNNILYQYQNKNKSKPTKMYLVDWQIVRPGHPCVDICYYLFCSSTSEMRQKHFKSLLIYYFSTLKSSLSMLGIDLDKENYSQQQFLREAHNSLYLVMLMTLLIFPMVFESSLMAEVAKKEFENLMPSGLSDTVSLEMTLEQKMALLFSPELIFRNHVFRDRLIGLITDIKNMKLLE